MRLTRWSTKESALARRSKAPKKAPRATPAVTAAVMKAVRAWGSQGGKVGGKTRWAGVSAEDRSKHARMAAAARWKGRPK
jgi:hypothetical protein